MNGTKAESDIEVGSFPRFRPEPDSMEHALSVAEQLPNEGGAHARAAARFSHVEVP